jgi:hypothetical protein
VLAAQGGDRVIEVGTNIVFWQVMEILSAKPEVLLPRPGEKMKRRRKKMR